MAYRRPDRAMLRTGITRMRGATMVEFHIVTLFAMLPLCMGLLQAALLATQNHHVDHAAFMAARAGATAGGSAESMREEFARVMTPLFVTAGDPLEEGNVSIRVVAAYAGALQDFMAYGSMRILAPDPATQRDFSEQRDGIKVIPNDSLEHRSQATGRESGITVQAANVLRVEFTYCRPLIVPFARHMLIGLLRYLDGDPVHARCYLAGRAPIVSVGTAPMQSDFRIP